MIDIDPVTGRQEEEISWGEGTPAPEEGEVSALLGFDFDTIEAQDRTGLRALIGSALVSHRRLPALEVILERASRQMSGTLRHLAGDALEVSLDSITSARFGDFMEDQGQRVIFAPIRSPSLDNYSLITVDTGFIFSIVDFLLGGHRAMPGPESEPHVFTSIELALIRRVIEAMCSDLSEAFSTILTQAFTLDRVETSARFAAITQPSAACVIAKFRVDMGESLGYIRMVLPYASLEPVQSQLLNEYAQEDTGTRWRRALVNEISTTSFVLSIVLAQKQLTLGDIARLKVGDLWMLEASLDDPVHIKVGERVLAKGHLGRSGDMIAVRLDTDIAGAMEDAPPLPALAGGG